LIGFGVPVLLLAGLSGFAIYSGRSSQDLFETVERLKSAELIAATRDPARLAMADQLQAALATGELSRTPSV
jgi:hypothetical protein